MVRVETGPYKFGCENTGYFLSSNDAYNLGLLLNQCERFESIDALTKSQLKYWARELKNIFELI